jgi:cobalamin biosynthesis protein CbiG
MTRTRGYRRSKDDLAKRRVRRSLMGQGLDDKDIGKLASVHCKPCSCYMCGNARKYNGKTVQERKQYLVEYEDDWEG